MQQPRPLDKIEHSADTAMTATQGRETGKRERSNALLTAITPERIRAVLRNTPPEIDENEPRVRRAAVIVPVILRREPVLLFTRRTEHLSSHAGQICFPGGSYHASDGTLIQTALRELEEEIGLSPESVEIAGFLDAYETLNTGFRILPVVGFVQEGFHLTVNAHEVAEIFEAPLSYLLDPRNHAIKHADRGGVLREFYAITWEKHVIWGATAAMIVNLSERLRGTAPFACKGTGDR
jgi:8-oxo-dGTP pyrophosphatase MutT (NUDIX family)